MSHVNLKIPRIFAGLIFLAGAAWILAPAASAQNGPPGLPPHGHWRGHGGPMGFGHRGFGRVVTGAPYTAQAVTAMVETLSNGSTITRRITATIARDNEGRTMRSQAFNGFGAAGGSNNGVTIVTIFDPVANRRIEYNTATKRARIFTLPEKSNESQESGEPANSGSTPAQHHNRFNSSKVSTQTESLGSQTISGVMAQGTQTTRTIAAGAIGNSQALQTTDVRWFSPDLQMVIQSTRNDPRFGQTTYTVSNIQRAEPNAALFQVPEGYQTKTIERPSRPAAQ